jgi:small subunit ribosomal protein S20
MAQKAIIEAISSLDKAAEKGVIHPNNAARRKSRLMKKLNEAKALASAK